MFFLSIDHQNLDSLVIYTLGFCLENLLLHYLDALCMTILFFSSRKIAEDWDTLGGSLGQSIQENMKNDFK